MKPVTRRLLYTTGVLLVLLFAAVMFMRQVPESVSAPLFVLVVLVEVIVAPIPGGAIGYMGAARFGFLQAWPLLYIGNAIGTVIVFHLARRIGAPLFQDTVSESTRKRYNRLLESNVPLLWFVYSVPLIPVDILSVLAGLSKMSARRFLTIALTGYVLYTGIVAFIGAYVAQVVGVTEAVSVIGVILLVGIAWWLWRKPQNRGTERTQVGSGSAPPV